MTAAIVPQSVGELADLVRGAERPFRIRGAGTWMDARPTVGAADTLQLDAFSGVRAYEPADLTIAVGACTTLRDLDAVTAAHGQWCPLLPWGTDDATVGATIATATTGPFAGTLGRPRDLVLGLECVDGNGRVIRAGGRVVKNVAGFDLTRLMTGSWGSLAAITEVHLRLRARPALDETWHLAPADAAGAAAIDAFVRGPLAPIGSLALTPRLSAALGLNVSAAGWLVRIGGNASYMNAARAAVGSLGPATQVAGDAWRTLRREAAPTPPAWAWNTLARDIKARFDPRRLLNPGVLGERVG